MPNIEFISNSSFWSQPVSDIVVSGNYAYVCSFSGYAPDNTCGLYIVDVSDPYSPFKVSFTYVAYPVRCFVKDDFIYIERRNIAERYAHDVYSYNISNPYNPTGARVYPTQLGDIYVENNYLYILYSDVFTGGGNTTLDIYNVLDPYSPVITSRTICSYSSAGIAIYIKGNYAYIVGQGSQFFQPMPIPMVQLIIYDISNPHVPVFVSATNNTNFICASYIEVVGNYAYISVSSDPNGVKTILIYDISNPLMPQLVSSIHTNIGKMYPIYWNRNRFAIKDDALCNPETDGAYSAMSASYFNGLSVYNISSPSNPLYESYVHNDWDKYLPQQTWNVFINGGYLYAAGADLGIYSIDNSDNSSSQSEEPPPIISGLTIPLINQKNQNLLPFTLISERGNVNSSNLTFTIDSLNTKYLNVDSVINRDNGYLTSSYVLTNDTYVPETEDAKYKHQSEFYVDIISEDISGLRDVRMHVEPNAYDFEKVNDAFIIPKFTWDNLAFSNSNTTTTTTTIGFLNNIWIGTENGQLEQIHYNYESASNNYSTNISSYIRKILFSDFNSKAYISTNDSILVYNIDHYIDSFDIVLSKSLTNDDNTLIVLDDSVNNKIWGVRSYSGNVVEYNSDTLGVERIHSGFDAPFKILKSIYHNAYFVAGTHILWQIKNNIVTSVYEINDYRIADFDISDKGEICLLLDGDKDDVIRILKNNLYSFLLNKTVTNANLRYCKYCGQGIFYILSEQDTNSTSLNYDASHWVFNSNLGKIEEVVISGTIFTTSTTTTLAPTNKTIEIIYPKGEEELAIGNTHELKWISNKAINDFVKIELYKKEYLYGTIADKVENTGIYSWNIPSFVEESEEYKLKITWLSSNPDPNNSGLSANNFTISSNVATTTTTTTLQLPIITSSIGIMYDKDNQQIVIVLSNGTLLIFSLLSRETFGLLDFGIADVSAVGMGRSTINELDKQSKIRIFVGSSSGLSDMWDGGVIETSSTSCYYGNGNNLVPGNRYFVGLQIYSDKEGWGALNIREFIMPK